MNKYSEIKHIELELSSYCNAVCPLCPRNLFGYPYNSGYPVKHLTLTDIQTIIDRKLCNQIEEFAFEGNLGDPCMNPEILEIIDYLDTHVTIYTNGGMHKSKFWAELAARPVTIIFGIDGLEGVHEIYRRNTNFNTVIRNAQAFINAGGIANWKMIQFDHNSHQIDASRDLANKIGFEQFYTVDYGRNAGPVFNRNGELENIIGKFHGNTDLTHYLDIIENGDMYIEDIDDEIASTIECASIKKDSIYINSAGEVYPCCFMGFSPSTFGHGRWHQPVNKQINDIIQSNNALNKPLKECIKWFNNIPVCWNKTTFEDGRLIVCDAMCGTTK